MNDKQRLEEIRQILTERDTVIFDEFGGINYPNYDELLYELNNRGHIDWLYKQARNNITAQEVVSIQGDALKQSMEENKRYKQALEFYADDESWAMYDHHGRTPVGIDGGQKASKALRGETNVP